MFSVDRTPPTVRVFGSSTPSSELSYRIYLRLFKWLRCKEVNTFTPFISKQNVRQSEIPAELQVQNEAINKESKHNTSSLEIELNELQERYLHMSLKYAEVEAQREELVLKLKAVGPGRSWFS
ncbi:hypothetical protein Tco_0884654 [Tanacetum coccineum]